ncbi:MAG TPA: cyanophycin synthetase [Candidatus Saccharimonadales bacterium]|nr:cyanophycin synthetase [Candidatus Saccharimonadales bacterium]
MGAIDILTAKTRAQAAAMAHRWPAKNMQVILVSGADGSELTVAALAFMLRTHGQKVGSVTSQFIEIAGERAEGSDQADVLGDPFRMQALLAQMRRAGCQTVIIEVLHQMPPHGFAGIQPTMVISRRNGDSRLPESYSAGRKALWQRMLNLHPKFVAANRDDPAYVSSTAQAEITTMTFGAHEKAECRITQVDMRPKGCLVTLTVDHQTELKLAFAATGKTAIYSFVAAASAAYLLHVPIGIIENSTLALPHSQGVLQYASVERPYQIALDTNITPDGLAESLEALKNFTKNRLIVVIGASLSQPAQWRPAIGELVAGFADRIIITDGEHTAEEAAQVVRQQLLQGITAVNADARTDEIPDREAALEKALSIARRGDTIAILASTRRPYRQLGSERLPWSDAQKLEELLS